MVRPRSNFWDHVQKTEYCWFWTLKPRSDGYGRFGHDGVPAHRLSWEIHNGPIPKGLCVLHRCDVPLCVNPDHLFLGTQADNQADKMSKGRYRRPHSIFKPGPLHPRWKGTP